MFGRKTYLNTTARKKEIDKALASLKRLARRAPDQPGAKKLLAILQKHRDRLHGISEQMQRQRRLSEARMKKLGEAAESSLTAFASALDKSRKAFAHAARKSGKVARRAVR